MRQIIAFCLFMSCIGSTDAGVIEYKTWYAKSVIVIMTNTTKKATKPDVVECLCGGTGKSGDGLGPCACPPTCSCKRKQQFDLLKKQVLDTIDLLPAWPKLEVEPQVPTPATTEPEVSQIKENAPEPPKSVVIRPKTKAQRLQDFAREGKGTRVLYFTQDMCDPCVKTDTTWIANFIKNGWTEGEEPTNNIQKINVTHHPDIGDLFDITETPTLIGIIDFNISNDRLTYKQIKSVWDIARLVGLEKPGTPPVTSSVPQVASSTSRLRTASELKEFARTYNGDIVNVIPPLTVYQHLLDPTHGFQASQLAGLTEWEMLRIHSGNHNNLITPSVVVEAPAKASVPSPPVQKATPAPKSTVPYRQYQNQPQWQMDCSKGRCRWIRTNR